MKTKYVFLLPILLAVVSTHAQVLTWTGGGGDGEWTTASNWDGNMTPTKDNDVVIQGAQIQLSMSGTAKSIQIENAELGVTSSGELFVIASDTNGITGLNSLITNNGLISIDSSNSDGLYLDQNSDMDNLGDLQIMNSEAAGISIIGSFSNEHQINIGACDVGIHIIGKLTSSGTIDISNITNEGIINEGVEGIMNSDTIRISNVNGVGLSNNFFGVCRNLPGGYLEIFDSNSPQGIFASDSLFNEGKIILRNLPNEGLRVQKYFENNGILRIDSTTDNGITGIGDVINDNLGVMVLTNCGLNNSAAFELTGNLINHNLIRCEDQPSVAISLGGLGQRIENYDSIHVINSGFTGITVSDTMINHGEGVILCENTNNIGLRIGNHFTNLGEIKINQYHKNGVTIGPSGILDNSGLIRCLQGTDGGLRIQDQGQFTNQSIGTVRIVKLTGDNSLDPNAIWNDEELINYGQLKLDSIDGFGILNSDSLVNFGSILLNDTYSIGEEAIFNLGHILNDTTGILEITNHTSPRITLLSNGVVINNGFLNISNSNSTALEINLGNFTNTSILQIQQAENGIFLNDEAELINTGQILIENIVDSPLTIQTFNSFSSFGEMEIKD